VIRLDNHLGIDPLELADYRRRVAETYSQVRNSDGSPKARWRRFCLERDRLFKSHPQSALTIEQKAAFSGLRYYPYNPALRLILPIEPLMESTGIPIDLQGEGIARLLPFGKILFEVEGTPVALTLYWIAGYGGGIFLPFRDPTGPSETYGGGRYLLDTIKGADLGREDERLVIDFNYAYNPSCAYNPFWRCPLAPKENWLAAPIRAGELKYGG
jgi:uncharacterized protein (DUF1684 family)